MDTCECCGAEIDYNHYERSLANHTETCPIRRRAYECIERGRQITTEAERNEIAKMAREQRDRGEGAY